MTLTPPPIPGGLLDRWCRIMSDGSESPPGAFLPSGLALLSATVGPRMTLTWGNAHTERMNLWVLNVGMSALDRKTSGLSGLRAAIKWTLEAGDDLIRLHNVHRISDAGLVTHLDIVTKDTEKARKTDADHPEVHRPVPLSWVCLFNEVASVWKDDPRGWEAEAQRSLLSIYDGQLSSTTKATNVPTQDCFVTAVGNIPPGVLKEQTTLQMLASGFVGRWLIIPTPPPETVVSFRPAPDGHAPLNPLRVDVSRLMRLARKDVCVNVNGLWTKEAIDYRHAWYKAHYDTARRRGDDDPLRRAASELFGRLQATAIKVATLLAVSRSVEDLDGLGDVRVEVEDARWAQDVIDRSIHYMIGSLNDSGAVARTVAGKVEGRILRWLEKQEAVGPDRSVTVSRVADMAKGGDVSRLDISRALDTLVNVGAVRVESDGRGRRVWLLQEAAA